MAGIQTLSFDRSPAASQETDEAGRIVRSEAVSGGWITGRAYDAFFIANILWPVMLLLQFAPGFEGRSGVQFWQLYFVTTPHRWITLLVVLIDRERFQERRMAFIGLALVIVLICLSVRITTGTLTCLLAADYTWNAWHFAAQHHGVFRIYSRIGSPPTLSSAWQISLEKWLIRGFLLYVIFRTAVAASAPGSIETWLSHADWCSLAVPGWLVARELTTLNARAAGRSLYLISCMSLYVSLLWAVHTHRPEMVLSLATASAWFHASEYLAVISWYTRRQEAASGEQNGILRWVAPRWGLMLLMFAVVLGSCSWLLDRDLPDLWLLVNVIVAFLHYSYDGMIWKNRRTAGPQSAPPRNT